MARLATPATLDEACALLAEGGGDAIVLGGGTALQMLRRRGEFACQTLVDLKGIAGLGAIERDERGLSIGALATHRRVELDPLVRETAPVLCDVAAGIANVRVRNAATIGGNLAHVDYRLDPPGALLVLGATLEIASAQGTREIAIGDLFAGTAERPGSKGLAVDDVLARVRVPAPPKGSRLLFAKYKSLGNNDWPCAAVTAMRANGTLALGITAAAPAPVRLELDTDDLDAAQAADVADAATDEAIDPIADLRGGAAFKRRVTRVLVRDTVARLWA